MQISIFLIAFSLSAANVFCQEISPKNSDGPATICTDPGKVELKGYDKKMSYSNKPFSGNEKAASIAPDTSSLKPASSIHSQEWTPERTRQHDSPCSKAKPPINL